MVERKIDGDERMAGELQPMRYPGNLVQREHLAGISARAGLVTKVSEQRRADAEAGEHEILPLGLHTQLDLPIGELDPVRPVLGQELEEAGVEERLGDTAVAALLADSHG